MSALDFVLLGVVLLLAATLTLLYAAALRRSPGRRIVAPLMVASIVLAHGLLVAASPFFGLPFRADLILLIDLAALVVLLTVTFGRSRRASVR
jgi:hypothetical protein